MQTTSIHQCPGCGTVVHFAHGETTILPCSCGTVINRKEGGTLLSRPYYIIREAFDHIQPGTTGIFQGKSFSVLGRFRAWFKEAVINYWTITLDGGELAYLAEGYGLYAILKKTTAYVPPGGPALSVFDIGHTRDFGKGEHFLLVKKSICLRLEVEGEVWLPETKEPFTIYELASENKIHLQLFQFLPNYLITYDAHYVSFKDLQLKNLREEQIPGREFKCKSCSNSIKVKTYPYAQSCVCNHCGNRYSLEGESFRSLLKRNEIDSTPDIPIGSIGTLKGIAYEVIGYAIKEENNRYAAQWKEYTLFNREEGYAFLSEFEGHWIFLREIGETPVILNKNAKSFSYQGEPFQLYNGYSYNIIHVAGEFPYNIFAATDTYVKEFISPPEMWSQEKNKKEGITWFFGEHIEGSALKKAFGDSFRMPYKSGIGAVEPRFFISPPKLAIVTAVAILCLAMVHVFISFGKRNQTLLEKTFLFDDSTNTINYVSQPLELDKWRSNLQFKVYAPIDNDWFELNATLVNVRNGTEYSLEKGVEYYAGYSDGEYWTEGSREEVAYMTQVPEGSYILQIQGIRSASSYIKIPEFQLQVNYDVSNDRNLWFCIMLLLIWPVVQYYRTNTIEKQRWENSPYTPYSYED